MRNLTRFSALLPLALALAACGGQPADEGASEPAADTAAAPEAAAPEASAPAASATEVAAAPAAGEKPAAFAVCTTCHSVEPGKNGVGPSLAGVAGRKAASGPGFTYSDALKGSGLTWDDATLESWLAGPQKLVPGTRMVNVMADPAQRKAVIDYLKTLK